MEEQRVTTFQQILDGLDKVSGFVWGPYLLIPLLLGVGVVMMIGLKFLPLRKLFPAFVIMWKGRIHDPEHKGELSPFKALMTSMAATVGTGNIVGVATAILLGGPGAIFWMWVTAIFGMATKYCEALLAVKYREVTPDGSYVGGPMYYIKNGLGRNWKWMATLFAVFGMVASFGIGNLTQVNAITANVIRVSGGTSEWIVALVLLVLAGVVLIGGVKRIGNVAGTLVPVMALIYIVGGLIILIMNINMVPEAFRLIFAHAFAPASAIGGFAGATVAMAIRFGVARGLFSNEAGLGSAPIAHATAIVKSPVRQGMLGMLDPFLDTIVVCSITALVILVSGQWTSTDVDSAGTLTSVAFDTAMPGGAGTWLVTIGLLLFAFSTILGWCVYGERCAIYLLGHKAALPFRIIFTLVVPLGAVSKLELVWLLSDIFNGLMAIPNLIALLLLCPVVFKMTRAYFSGKDEEAE